MEVFFYGLFMDSEILLQNGIQPINLRIGCLNDYVLKIGNRASLIPCKNEKSYGIVLTVKEDSIQNLYAKASVADYIPEEVYINIPEEEIIKAVCYNLPIESITGTNAGYAKALFKLAQKLGFPDEYLEKIKRMTKEDID